MKAYTRWEAAKAFEVMPWEVEAREGVGLFDGIKEFWHRKDQTGGKCFYKRDVVVTVCSLCKGRGEVPFLTGKIKCIKCKGFGNIHN